MSEVEEGLLELIKEGKLDSILSKAGYHRYNSILSSAVKLLNNTKTDSILFTIDNKEKVLRIKSNLSIKGDISSFSHYIPVSELASVGMESESITKLGNLLRSFSDDTRKAALEELKAEIEKDIEDLPIKETSVENSGE